MDRLAALLRRAVADPRTDGQLLAAFLAERDEAAFAELVRRHGPLVWGVCRRAFANRTDAEDAFQATFLVLVRRAPSLTDSPTLGPWLFKVASWTVRTHRRSARRHLAHELPSAFPDPQSDFTQLIELDEALLSLPERCRVAVLLCHLEGLSHREAAKRLGCAEGTVSSLVSRGLAKLRTKFADPVALVALVGMTVPAAVADAAVRSAVSFQLASCAASPAVLALTHGVLRMFWINKATVTALAAALVLLVGIGIGVLVREAPHALAQDKPTEKKTPLQDDVVKLGELFKVKATPTIQVTIGEEKGSWRLSVTEFDDAGKPMWTVLPLVDAAAQPKVFLGAVKPLPDPALELKAMQVATRTYLTRATKDPAAPKTLRIVVEDGATLEYVWAAVEAAKAAGFKTLRYTGCIPPGCSIKTGVTPDQVRHNDAELPLDNLLETLRTNSVKC